MDEDQQDIDSAAEHQQMLDEQRENSGVMDPRCFTKPMPQLPRLTPKEQFDVDMAQVKALDWAIRRMLHE